MVEQLSDDEEREMVKKWWREYGRYLLVAIVIGVAAGYGWRAWLKHQNDSRIQASLAYENLVQHIVQHPKQMQAKVDGFLLKYPGSIYGVFTAWLAARQEVMMGQYSPAAHYLQWSATHAKSTAIQGLSRLKWARVILALKKPKQALEILQAIKTPSLIPLQQKVQGDAYMQLGQSQQAQQAYAKAKAGLKKWGYQLPNLKLILAGLS